MKKKHEAEKENGERWMLTYLDMITLLFVFFVVLYAMSKIDEVKYEAVADALNSSFASPDSERAGSGEGEGKIISEKTQKNPEIPIQSATKKSRTFDKAYDVIKTYRLQDKVKVRQEQRGIVVQLGEEIFFSPGKADLPADITDTLVAISAIASTLPNDIQIEGYSDSSPPDPGSGFASNWDLSAKRAINVLEYLEMMGVDTSRMSAVAFGSTHPFASNDTPEGRSYNRRIDIVFLYSAEELQH